MVKDNPGRTGLLARPKPGHPRPVRICIVTIAMPVHGIGGMQDHAADLAAGLAAAGHRVEILTAAHPDGLDVEEREGVRVHYLPAPGLHMDAQWRAASLAAFDRLSAVEPFDVLHSEGSSALELVRRGRDRATPTVVMFHGNFLGLARAAARRARRRPALLLREAALLRRLCLDHFPHGNWRVFRRCEAIVPSQQQLRGTQLSHVLRKNRIHVVPNGVDTELFAPAPQTEARAELGLPPGPLAVCVGRLNREKGFGRAVAALQSVPELRLVVVGDGEERAPLELQAREQRVAERVTFAGAQPHERIARYLAAADLFLFPTERDEAAPLVLPQALAAGAAVIASACGGVSEVVGANEAGVLVPPGDTAALAATAARLLEQPDERRRLQAAARRRAVERYSLDAMVAGTEAVYRLARARHAPTPIRPTVEVGPPASERAERPRPA
jgi:glycosyltransferase involved in cell wall biosynthesis